MRPASALVYSTYLGGSGDEIGNGIAVDAAGNAYVTGLTSSTDFPTANPLQPSYGGGSSNAFVAKIGAVTLSPTSLRFQIRWSGHHEPTPTGNASRILATRT